MSPIREWKLVEEARTAAREMDIAAARAKATEAIDLLLAHPEDERGSDWSWVLDAAGRVASDVHDHDAARKACEEVLEVRSRTLPKDHLDIEQSRGSLATALWRLGDPIAARVLQERVLEVYARTLPADHPDLQIARMNLALTLWTLGELTAARALLEKALEVSSRRLPDDHPDLQKLRTNLAVLLHTLGEMAAGRALQEKIVEVDSRTLPEDHPDLQGARVNLGNALYSLGDLGAARALQEKALDVLSRTLPEDHPTLQAAELGLATILLTLGDLAAARELQEKVLEVCSRTMPDDHPDLQVVRANLASTLHALGDYAAARVLMERVLEVHSRTLPEDHHDLQKGREILAKILFALGDLGAARALQEQVLEIVSRTLPDDHPDLQLARMNLANTLWWLCDLAAARTLMEEILEVSTRTLSDDHPTPQVARANLALVLAAETAAKKGGGGESPGTNEDGKEFARLTASFTRAIARSARTAVLTVSSREAEERCVNAMDNLGRALSFAEGLGTFESDPGLEREAFVLSEETRGAALASAHLARRAIGDPDHGRLRERMRSASDELARLTQQGASSDEIDRARRSREAAEQALAALARAISGNEKGVLEFDPAWISATLSDHEALVGFRRYSRSGFDSDGGCVPRSAESLCAFILRSGDRVELIQLGPIEPVEQAVNNLRRAIGAGRGRGIGANPPEIVEKDPVLDEGRVVRSLIFDPLLPALEGAERIVVALDDVLHLVPLDALPLEPLDGTHSPAEGWLLGDRWRVETRCTLSELSWKAAPVPPGESLVAIGGAAFDLLPLRFEDEETESMDERRAPSPEVTSLLRGGAWEAGFPPLEQTGPEARGIAELYGEAFRDRHPALVLENRKASRAGLLELAPKARFLHAATHGWFAPESVRSIADPEPLDKRMGFGSRMSGEERARGMTPMLLCGLALAGANLPEDELGRAPGLITAEEISTLDLTGCELAVLSACDTNVGQRRAGQGVASLQKALHMAGARTVITSLWKVPDEATRELMLDFYRHIWIEEKPKGVALWEAKKRIRDAKDENGKLLYSTRDWAAWVLTGDPN